MRTVNLVLKKSQARTGNIPAAVLAATILAAAAIVITILIASCTKSPPTTGQGLLTWKDWKLKRVDKLHLDANNQISGETTTILSEDCKTSFTRIYGTDRYIKGYFGCIRPLILSKEGYTYYYYEPKNQISLTLAGPPRGGPELQLTDSVIKLTADSLIVVNAPSGSDYPYQFYYKYIHYLLREYYTH